MEELKLFDSEYKFVSVIWDVEPVNSTELVKVCETRLGWKKSTTYTVLRKLTQRGVLCNAGATVTALVKREQVQRYESEALLERAFNGSLPAFMASFLHDRKLSQKEADEIRRMIEENSK